MLANINQSERLNSTTRKYLLGKIMQIRSNRRQLEEAAREQRRKEVIEAYKKESGYDKLEKRYNKIRADLKEVKNQMISLGINPDCGNLCEVSVGTTFYDPDSKTWNRYTEEQVNKVNKVLGLIEAAEKEIDTYSTMDRLETELMLSPTIGDALKILNAVAGKEVFKVQPQLENKE